MVKKCPECGADNRDDTMSCSSCGIQIAVPSSVPIFGGNRMNNSCVVVVNNSGRRIALMLIGSFLLILALGALSKALIRPP